MRNLHKHYCVVKVFSLNRIISLAERQAFTHCCELLQVWRKCFPCNLGKPKLYGKMFIFIILILIDICIGRCYVNFRLIFPYIINMPLCYVIYKAEKSLLNERIRSINNTITMLQLQVDTCINQLEMNLDRKSMEECCKFIDSKREKRHY